jgi:hypothetical protein
MQKRNCCQNLIPLLSAALLILFFICNYQAGLAQQSTIRNSIPVPDGYRRATYPGGSFSHYIQNLDLKDQPIIRDYQGKTIASAFYDVWEVVQMPLLFQSDLEQCADFAMRFWAEYHKALGKLDQLYLFDYNGKKKLFRLSGKPYAEFLKWAFANTNSHSLKRGCKEVAADQVVPGDLLVQNERGGIGHVSVILDTCQSKEGKRLLLIGYSFMPAQEFHIERSRAQYGIEGWFTLEGYTQYLADFLNFGEPVLRRFDSQ